MIRIRVSGVLRVLDGFTGRPLPPSVLRFWVDGAEFRPMAKGEGYYVLSGLAPGTYELLLRAAHYLDERVSLTVGRPEQLQELPVTMKPGLGYPFGGAVTRLTVAVSDKWGLRPRARVWVAVRDPRFELRVAQEAVHTGENRSRLFFPASARGLALPATLMLVDGVRSEICRLADPEEGLFDTPMCYDHKRSCPLYPAQVYTADGEGRIRAVLREPLPVELLAEGEGQPLSVELEPGDNHCLLSVQLASNKG